MLFFSSLSLPGDVEKAVTELIIDFDVNPEEESPYEALYNATSCHSLDSLASGRSSDRESMNKEAEGAGLKAVGVRPVRSCVCLSLLALERWGTYLHHYDFAAGCQFLSLEKSLKPSLTLIGAGRYLFCSC